MSTSPKRTVPEQVTFIVACLILLAVAAAIVIQAGGSTDPAAPVATPTGQVREQGGRFYVAIEVVNEGDDAASDVEVSAELSIGEEVIEAGASVDLLGGGESKEVQVVFEDDPATGEMTVRVSGFTLP